MSRISASGPIQQTTTADNQPATDLRQVDMDQFLQLLITELQNQDPLSPMDNSEILQQISQIREISATNELSDTLAAVRTGQDLTTASSVLGKHIRALADDGSSVEGVAERITVEPDPQDQGKRILRIHVGDATVTLNNVREIVDGELETSGE